MNCFGVDGGIPKADGNGARDGVEWRVSYGGNHLQVSELDVLLQGKCGVGRGVRGARGRQGRSKAS